MGERCSLYYHDYYAGLFGRKAFGYGELKNKDAKLLGIIRGVNNTPRHISWKYMFSIHWREIIWE